MDTRIAFGTDGWRAPLEEFTAERLRTVGQAVATYLSDHGLTEAPVAIGYDPREDSSRFARVLDEVLAQNGIDVLRVDRDLPTPVLAWTIASRGLAGGLMVTASHNPPDYNGVKFITAAGAPALPPVTDALEARLSSPRTLPAAASAASETLDPLPPYLDHLRDQLPDIDLDGVSVVYDAMHGSGRGVTDRVLRAAGASVNSYRCTRDPTFGGEAPEPEPDRLETLVTAVDRTDADLGIANDGDADRIAAVTPARGFLDENLLFAVLYDYLLERRDGPAIRTVSTTHLIDRIAAAHDENVVETAVGFKWVAAAMREHDALIGGEESGGFTVRNHVRGKDGVLVALLLAALTAEEPIDDRLDRIFDAHGEIAQDKLSIVCPDERKATMLAEIGDVLPDRLAGSAVATVSEIDGYKITLADDSWMLIRPSGTEPKIRVYAEAQDPDRVDDVLEAGRDLLEPLL